MSAKRNLVKRILYWKTPAYCTQFAGVFNLKKYHFNLFRALLEKTANFLGNDDWKVCLKGIEFNEDFIKIIDHYSHDKLSELEYSDLVDSQVKTYEKVFNEFLVKYNFKGVWWKCTNIIPLRNQRIL